MLYELCVWVTITKFIILSVVVIIILNMKEILLKRRLPILFELKISLRINHSNDLLAYPAKKIVLCFENNKNYSFYHCHGQYSESSFCLKRCL